ncbi:MAG: CDP-alcohol phosphatidyltransferase family protein [Planctomycetota bacterium]|nr:CDP-alcohol phosphatidyltransferase family protein [Planctomycetota bacterium]
MPGSHDHAAATAAHAAQPSRGAPRVGAFLQSLPNLLTCLRLVIAAGFFVLLATWTYPIRELVVSPRHPVSAYLVAAALFGLAALTDAIDGPLARRWNVVSVFGRVMDPFADKVLVVGAFIMLAGPRFAVEEPGRPYFQVSGVEPWMVVIILGRELLVTSIRAVAESAGKDFSADWSGKLKMILQACVIPFILVMLGVTEVKKGTAGRLAIDIAVWTTLIATIVSAVPYIVRARKVLG